jgi:hypothetical protein
MVNPLAQLWIAGSLAAVTDCGDGQSPKAPEIVPLAQAQVVKLYLPHLLEADGLIAVRHPSEIKAMTAAGATVASNGLIGRNRRYGRLVSPRFQMGAGAALRSGLHIDPIRATNAFRAIEVGTSAIAPGGEVHSYVPPDAPKGATLKQADIASGAAFFMADACPAMLALQAFPHADSIAARNRQKTVIASLGRGLDWLIIRADDLEQVDRRAPNRLLHDALAFHSCGVLTDNDAARALASRFVKLALSQTRADGVFIEKGGSDTNYQAVAVKLSADLLLTGYTAPEAERLNTAWQTGAVWLGNRIFADGTIDSSNNTRTCKGGESFLGTPKKASVSSVYGALIYIGELASDEGIKRAASRVAAWAEANPRTDPCFP